MAGKTPVRSGRWGEVYSSLWLYLDFAFPPSCGMCNAMGQNMNRLNTRIALFILAIPLLVCSGQAAPPKLIVAILIDQMRYDYLERFQAHFSTNGFRLLTERGAFMTFAHYNYVPTVTGPGHASFLSGTTPMMHGIIANDWFDRKTGKELYCVEDPSVDGVGATPATARMSPKNFIGGTFADELRLRFGSKVIGISMKDRGAVLPAGKKPAGAFWFHAKNGNFVTSTYYMQQLPNWVQEFNKRKRADQFMGQTWKRLLDEKEYLYPDAGAGEANLPDEKKPIFDHKVAASKDSFENILSSPYGNQLLEEFAEAAIEGEKLGQGNQPDLLTVSFSSVDYVGHKFGPYSQEIEDVVLRLDRQLEQFFNYLDRKIGLKNVYLTLTADHAMAPIPEFAKEQGLDGQRLDETDFLSDLKIQLSEEYGPGRYLLSSKLYGGNLYLNYRTLDKKRLNPAEAVAFIRDFALASGKFQACFTREQLLDGRAPGPLGQLVFYGYNAERGGDLVFIEKPYSMPG
ncbi:MAG TPA: alkaline phosphatase family protein, partial [Verrucomicrobiae bacterium]|nr:alkaline phosphatase family protein [Verrucomicrobiae bacterium]